MDSPDTSKCYAEGWVSPCPNSQHPPAHTTLWTFCLKFLGLQQCSKEEDCLCLITLSYPPPPPKKNKNNTTSPLIFFFIKSFTHSSSLKTLGGSSQNWEKNHSLHSNLSSSCTMKDLKEIESTPRKEWCPVWKALRENFTVCSSAPKLHAASLYCDDWHLHKLHRRSPILQCLSQVQNLWKQSNRKHFWK